MSLNTDSEIEITYEDATGKAIAITEAEFRKLLGHTLVALGDTGANDTIPPEIAANLRNVGEFFATDDETGDPDTDWSILGTFLTINQTMEFGERAPAGLECPKCGEDSIDALAHNDEGDELTCACGTTYSTDLDDATGKPRWRRSPRGITSYPVHLNGAIRWVTIPTDE